MAFISVFEVIGVIEVIASLEVIDITIAGDIDCVISGRTIVANFANFVNFDNFESLHYFFNFHFS